MTNSKRSRCFIEGVYPTHISHGFKCYLYDVDDNKYIDYICALGTNYFGYANPEITRAVHKAMIDGGSVFSLGSVEEVILAEKLKEVFPFIDKMRFLKTGSEGCSAAVRIARAYTGKEVILAQGYNGWHDQFIKRTPPALGAIEGNVYEFSPENLEKHNDNIAAIILEPIITDHSEGRLFWLSRLKEMCDKRKILLIFDETITAYRFPQFCAAKQYNIYPDIWIGGKALGGGLPLSVVGGRKAVMKSDYFVSSTWAGDRLAIAAALKGVELSHSLFRPSELWDMGSRFLELFNAICDQVQIVGYPTRGVFKYKAPNFKALYMQEMCKAGVLIGPTWFYNKHLHTEMENVLSISKMVIKKIKNGECRLEGSMPQSPFAEKVRKS